MKAFLRGLISVPFAALMLGTVFSNPARAAGQAVSCGAKITVNTTLTSDLGPCPGDGVDIAADGITLNLNGHSITGSDTSNTTVNEQTGVNLVNVRGVTVTGPGTITAFDAGVGVTGGSSNTVKRLGIHDNIAHVLLSGGVPGDPQSTPCNLGDGIAVDNSTSNHITGNTVNHNGPFSGIALVNSSVRNIVDYNRSINNSVPNDLPGGAGSGPCGREHQDIGIRVEGPGAQHNTIAHNTSTDNLLEGISIHSNVCASARPNNDNMIEYNTVLRNGFADNTDGISILQQGPLGVVCPSFGNRIIGNVSNGNSHDGIFVAGRGSHDNKIIGNTVANNGNDGIELRGPSRDAQGNLAPGSVNNTITNNVGRGNGSFDGFDFNLSPPCDHNIWAANRFGSVNQPCVAGNGGTGTLPPPGPITSVTTSGTSANPTITVRGSGFGASPPVPDPSTSPVGQQGCPSTYANGTPIPTAGGGFLYGTKLFFQDITSGWTAGLNGNGQFDCIGIVIDSWSDTQVVFHFGNIFGRTDIPNNAYFLRNGDAFTVGVGTAQFTGVATVSG
ncbi:MAG: right-handed parallel beta-helix repeat-containing protein [Actinomycetota bacterium]|nr:right-handed parallel beta-helix repeat-containing protein [Actinomycetota bacterium]